MSVEQTRRRITALLERAVAWSAAGDLDRAVAAGIDGIVLSNHGGRQLDGAISGIEALPEVVRAVGGRARPVA